MRARRQKPKIAAMAADHRDVKNLAEVLAMLDHSGLSTSTFAAKAGLPPSTLNKPLKEYRESGKVPRFNDGTMQKLRDFYIARGFPDWRPAAGPFVLDKLATAWRAVVRIEGIANPESADLAARMLNRIYNALVSEPDLSAEVANRMAQAIAEGIASEIRRDQQGGSTEKN